MFSGEVIARERVIDDRGMYEVIAVVCDGEKGRGLYSYKRRINPDNHPIFSFQETPDQRGAVIDSKG